MKSKFVSVLCCEGF